MKFSVCSPLALILGACTVSEEVFEEPDVTPDCDIVITSTWPADGAVDVYNRDPIEFNLSNPAPNAVVVADFDGIQTVSEDGLVISYTPAEPLEPETTYTVGLDYCYSTPEISFTTSDLGESLMDDVSMLGMTWIMDPADGEYLEGAGLASTMTSIFDRALIAGVVDVRGSQMVWRLGVSDELGQEQDECYRTVEVDGVDFSEAPFFSFDAPSVNFGAFNGELTFYDFQLDGTISADGEMFGGVNYSVTIDIAELVAVMDVSDVDTLCAHAANLGSNCVPCPEGDSVTCATVTARGLHGRAASSSVVHVEESDAIEGCD